MLRDRAAWQQRFDEAFPHGALCTWDRPQDDIDTIYRVPRIDVIGVSGTDPVINLSAIENDHVIGPERVVTYDPVKPGGRWPAGTVRVTFGLAPDAMFWNPAIPKTLLRSMTEERNRRIEQGADDQGPGVLHAAGADSGVPAPGEGNGP